MHVLATELASLDEVDVAVDLGQSPAEVVVLSFSDTDLSALAAAWQRDAERLPTLRLASLKRLRHPMSVDLYLESVVSQAKAVIVRCLGGLDYWRYGLERIADLARDNGILFAALPGDDRADPRLASMSTMATGDLVLLDRFFREGGADNLNQALRLVGARLGSEQSWHPPAAIGPLTVLGEARGAGPVVLVIFYRANLLAADIEPITALMRALEKQGLAPLGVAVSSLKDPAVQGELGRLIESHRPAVILNTTAFSAMREDDTTVLDAADAPVLQVVLAGSTREAWSESGRGLSPSDLAMNVVLPELDGRLLTRAISFKAEADADPRLEFAAVRHVPDTGRIDYVARLASAWAALRGKEPSERRLALVLSDYPARGGRTGYAVGLDTTESTLEILRLLRDAGYDVGSRDWQAADIAPLLDRTARYLCCGKMIVLLQPDRGGAYHDVTAEPHPDYVAVYTWLREVEKIDALIHLGTHGTLEWLPGKALALSAECWPEKVLGPVPVIYPFIVNNPGEAAQAKRRLAAVTIGHLTPPLSAAGLNGPLADLEGLIEEYAAADEVVRRYLQDHGEHPRALVIDLWASASLRTGGDDLVQALAYLGVKPVWDPRSNRVTGIEVMPLAALDRPRIDVTLRISGLFRDIFEHQIALFDMAVRRVAALDEEGIDNPLAEARRTGESLARVFGGAPGSYGAQAGDLALDGAWQTREELGEAYLAAVTHAYGSLDTSGEAGSDFRGRVSAADALVHPQDDRERDLLDGDGVADFAGGFAAAAALLGNEPELYHLDTSQVTAPKARRLAEEIARIVRGRLTNPRWLSGMLSHGHRGVAEIAQSVDALFAFAATARAVPDHLFDAAHAALIADESVLSAMRAHNPAAAAAIVARLDEARSRGLWTTRRNSVGIAT